MSQAAIGVKEVLASKTSVDGNFVVIEVVWVDGSTGNLAIAATGLEKFITLLVHGAGLASVARGDKSQIFGLFRAEWWEVTRATNSDSIIVTFRMPGGMIMSYSLDHEAGVRMIETTALVLRSKAIEQVNSELH